LTLAGLISLTAYDDPATGQAITNEPALKLGISLSDTTGSLGVATTSGNITIQTTIILTAYDNPALGAAATPRLVQFFGSCIITSVTTIPTPEFE
jgi:hypothetical protein